MKRFKLKYWQAVVIYVLGLFIVPIILIKVYGLIPFEGIDGSVELTERHPSMIRLLFVVLYIIMYLVYCLGAASMVFLSDNRPWWIERGNGGYIPPDEDKEVSNPVSYTKVKIAVIALVLILIAHSLFKPVYEGCKNVYNTSRVYHYQYEQKVQSKKGFYDKLWKTYIQKEQIAGLNKETFIEVTKLIMENRADGKNITWKWVSENQHIPYEQFSGFYADLSNFIEQQRDEYYGIEVQCQNIAQANNTLLDTFPNNMYNRFLKCEKIDFQYGFLSDKTDSVFESKKENL